LYSVDDIWELAATIDVLMKDSVKTLIVGELEEECVGSIVEEMVLTVESDNAL
jgi:hypothetical protein